MRDQLSLRLEPEIATLPNLPDGLRPMLPRPAPEPFDSAAHLFEPAWGGLRALAFIGPAEVAGGGDVRIVDGDGPGRRARACPSSAGMAVRLDARSAILDGELVAVDDAGRADDAELERRIAGEPGRAVAFLAFDLLHLDGTLAPDDAAPPPARAAAQGAPPRRRGRGRARDRGRGPGAPRRGRGPGDRRDDGPPADEPVPRRASRRGCGGSSRVAPADRRPGARAAQADARPGGPRADGGGARCSR